ncbi:DUF6270 domain-containing protein [Micrococcus aloeverae]|uniref:DUF6270 domain-containing protein n=1 Tax=Micrococcus aloeverae TaxID=1391911 RepID=UPI00223BCEF7|nr:DUF6270 domain-containing protein [Micrococcus aloeverae]
MTIRIAVVGSRQTRNALVIDGRISVPTEGFLPRVSLAGWGTPTDTIVHLEKVSSEFNRRLVRRDTQRTLLADLVAIAPDLIVFDALEERWPLLERQSGAVLTFSPEFREAGDERGRRIETATDEHFDRWAIGWSLAKDELKNAGLLDRCVVHRAFLLVEDDNGSPVPGAEAAARVNAHLSRIYQRIEEDLSPERVIQLPSELSVAAVGTDGWADPLVLAEEGALALVENLLALAHKVDPAVAERSSIRRGSDVADRADLIAFENIDNIPDGYVGSIVVFLDEDDEVQPSPFMLSRATLLETGAPWASMVLPGGSATVNPDVGEKIESTIREISRVAGRDVLLVSRGRGGFAALRAAEELGSLVSVLIWNPVTSAEWQDLTQRSISTFSAAHRALIFQHGAGARLSSDFLPLVRSTQGAGPGPLDYSVDDQHVAVIALWGRDTEPSAQAADIAVEMLRNGASARTAAEAVSWGSLADSSIDDVGREEGSPIQGHLTSEDAASSSAVAVDVRFEAHCPARVDASAGLQVTVQEDGQVAIDWDLRRLGSDSAVGVDFTIERDRQATATVENALPPLILSPLALGEIWQIDLWDSHGRSVGLIRINDRLQACASHGSSRRLRRRGWRRFFS